ncbi:MAG: hypothetical protein CVU98_04025 [Firmicutes bacterium HGW-Firmicutes-3]|jgi:chemotaxis protein MotA|nr:MAG: hypothetical protein CVU98_04025 [Firmicutes bacterium HGW-Firmicutes-3]
MFSIIIKNLLGYDLIILLLALFNGFVIYPRAAKACEDLKNHLQPTIYVPISVFLRDMKGNHKAINLHEIKKLRDQEVLYMNILSTIHSVFPLLGILGTIIALLGMVDLEGGSVILNFTTALTSTFWGLVFAIGFKGINTTLLSKSELNSEDFELLIKRIDSINERGDFNEET